MEGLQCQVEDKAIYLVGQYSHIYYAYWINLIDIYIHFLILIVLHLLYG